MLDIGGGDISNRIESLLIVCQCQVSSMIFWIFFFWKFMFDTWHWQTIINDSILRVCLNVSDWCNELNDQCRCFVRSLRNEMTCANGLWLVYGTKSYCADVSLWDYETKSCYRACSWNHPWRGVHELMSKKIIPKKILLFLKNLLGGPLPLYTTYLMKVYGNLCLFQCIHHHDLHCVINILWGGLKLY